MKCGNIIENFKQHNFNCSLKYCKWKKIVFMKCTHILQTAHNCTLEVHGKTDPGISVCINASMCMCVPWACLFDG